MKEMSLKINYSGPESKYYDWANAMWSSGYNLPISRVMIMLHVSLSWVNRVLLNEIHYVVYSNKFVYSKFGGKTKTLTYIRESDLVEWIMSVGLFEVQTEMVDLYSYMGNDATAKKILKQYREDFKAGENFYNPGTIPVRVLQMIDREYYSYGTVKLKNISCARRKEVPFKEIEPFNIFECDIYFPADSGLSETVYRTAFLNGDIKVRISSKTIFIRNHNNREDLKMPFLIPYGGSIKLRKK